ncbi:hypothetical protein LPB138_08555 [Urechidicola croceus]|uniref:Uncharacterized protein n=2 Tax=Urechidicola croceus TaxID=1850246 RepID=A0A1D8P825_9FLAO|nr:hypothetical protein LPB138_08555 [Urechidicola croceus]
MFLSLMNFLGFGQEKKETELKTESELKLEEIFFIGDNNFFFDKSKCVVEHNNNKVTDFTFVGNKEIFEKLDEKDDFEFKYFIYPPELRIRNLTLTKNMETRITKNNHLDSEVGIYFGEHGLFEGDFFIKNGWIRIIGFGEVYGKKYPIKINFKL